MYVQLGCAAQCATRVSTEGVGAGGEGAGGSSPATKVSSAFLPKLPPEAISLPPTVSSYLPWPYWQHMPSPAVSELRVQQRARRGPRRA